MLTDLACKTAKPGEKPYKLYDSGGLYLLVKPSGSKLWQMKYSRDGKEQSYSIGPYGNPPLCVPLAVARQKRDEAKALLKEGRDPNVAKRTARSAAAAAEAVRFRDVCKQWWVANANRWEENHAASVWRLIDEEVCSKVGDLPVTAITTPILLNQVLLPLDARGAEEKAARLRQYLVRISRYARGQNLVPQGFDPAGEDARDGMPKKPPVKPHPALTDVGEIRELLRKSAAYACKPTTKLALRFQMLTAARARTLIKARWDQFVGLDGPLPIWEIPASQMKGKKRVRREFTIPLCTQAVEILGVLRQINGAFPHVFPSDTHPEEKHISNNTVTFHIYDLGYKGRHCQHGARASFSTIMNERHPALSKIIDFAIGHVNKNEVEAAYNRAKYIEPRRQLHQEYADLILDGAAPASELLAGPRH